MRGSPVAMRCRLGVRRAPRRSACMTSCAIGAAVSPPVEFCCSTTTAIATSGSVAAGEADEPGRVRPAMPVSAVPVLPPTRSARDPGQRCRCRPRPPSFIIARHRLAVSGLTARPSSCGLVRTTTEPSGATIRSTTYGSITTPSLAIAAATIAICSGVTSSRSWPKANRPGSTSESSSGRTASSPCRGRSARARSSGVSSGGVA